MKNGRPTTPPPAKSTTQPAAQPAELPAPRRLRSFLLRLWLDEAGSLRGQISELDAKDEWRRTFRGHGGLRALLDERFSTYADLPDAEKSKRRDI